MTSCDQQQRRNAIAVAFFVLLKVDIEEEKLSAPKLMYLVGFLALLSGHIYFLHSKIDVGT